MTKNKLVQWRGRIFRYAPLILWISIILSASSDQASMSQTSRFIGPLLQFIFPGASADTIYLYHHYIRKLGHFTAYFTLAFWVFRAFSGSSRNILKKYWFVCSIGLVALVASTDEFRQSFFASREGSIYDVLLDISGGLTFLLPALIYRKLRDRNNTLSHKY